MQIRPAAISSKYPKFKHKCIYTYVFMVALLLGVFAFFGIHDLLWLQRSAVGALRVTPSTRVEVYSVTRARSRMRPASRALPPWIRKAALDPPAASGATAVKQHSAPALLCG